MVVSSPEDPAPRGPVRIADLAGRPMVMFRHGYDLRELTVAACRAEGFEPSFAVEGGEMDAVLGFVRAGLGVAVVPGMVAARAGRDLRVTALAPPGLRRTVALAHRSDVAPPRAARELRRVLLRSTAGAERPAPSHRVGEDQRVDAVRGAGAGVVPALGGVAAQGPQLLGLDGGLHALDGDGEVQAVGQETTPSTIFVSTGSAGCCCIPRVKERSSFRTLTGRRRRLARFE